MAGLGPFVELETVLGDEEGDLLEEHAHVKALLGLDALPPVAGSYGDLLESNE